MIYTDLDGTLLDDRLSYHAAEPALRVIAEHRIPLVFVTSKTTGEVRAIQESMGIWKTMPFAVENGGAVYIPRGLLPADRSVIPPGATTHYDGDFFVISLGAPYQSVTQALHDAAQAASITVKGIGDMTVAEFARYTGLTIEQSHLARQRQYQEGFLIQAEEAAMADARRRLNQEITNRGFTMTAGGGFNHIMKGSSKQSAVSILHTFYNQLYSPPIPSVGFGDAPADIEFLTVCDQGYVVRNPHKLVPLEELPPGILITDEIGPKAWNTVVNSLL